MELDQLKKVLRCIAVSSPTHVDLRSLTRDFRNMMGEPIPIGKFGYRDLFTFLKERCDDCFLMNGPPVNPTLTLIVPKNIQHIDEHVRKQKLPSTIKFKGKRQSVPETAIKRPGSLFCPPPLRKYQTQPQYPTPTPPPPRREPAPAPAPPRPITRHEPARLPHHDNENVQRAVSNNTRPPAQECNKVRPPAQECNKVRPPAQECNKVRAPAQECNKVSNGTGKGMNHTDYTNRSDTVSDPLAVQNFFKKRLPQLTDEMIMEKPSITTNDDDSGRLTSSSCSSGKRVVLEELRTEVRNLISEYPEGLWSTDLLRLYRERYGREVPVERLGIASSIHALARALSDVIRLTRPDATGDWRVWDARSEPAPTPRRRLRIPAGAAPTPPPDRWDDALPGIDFDPSVFPEDCLHYVDSIPSVSLDDIAPGDAIEISVGEVYSPSHLWVLRLGEQHQLAMENIMDEMTKYYGSGEGRSRVLSPGAVRAGHYCTSLYEGDWHRSLIVQVLDADTVKVRHIDYGTVCRAAAASLKPLRREWAALPGQAARARLAGLRPAAGSRRWPHAAARRLLDLVRDKRLVGSVLAVDHEESILELYLIDTATDEDVCVHEALVAEGFADARAGAALHDQTPEGYLCPSFAALEGGETPNYEEISCYLRAGIALQYVEEYRRHVPLDTHEPRAPIDYLLRAARQRAGAGGMPAAAAAAETDGEGGGEEEEEEAPQQAHPPQAYSAKLNRSVQFNSSSAVSGRCQTSTPVLPESRHFQHSATGSGNFQKGGATLPGSGHFQAATLPGSGHFQSGGPTLHGSGYFQPGGSTLPGPGHLQPNGPTLQGARHFQNGGPVPSPGPGRVQASGPAPQGPGHFQFNGPPRPGYFQGAPPSGYYQPGPPPCFPSQMNQLNMMALCGPGRQFPPPAPQLPSQYNAALLQGYLAAAQHPAHYPQPPAHYFQPPPPQQQQQQGRVAPRLAPTPPPPAALPARAPAEPAPAPPSPAPLRLLAREVRVYRSLVALHRDTAADHLLQALRRAEAEDTSPATDDVCVRRLDADIFRKLLAVDADTAHDHMRALLDRAAPPAPSPAPPATALNPHAAEFPAPAAETYFDSAGACIRPPPGFENHFPAPATEPHSPDVD